MHEPRIEIADYKPIEGFFLIVLEGWCPQPCVIQGSTVYSPCNMLLLAIALLFYAKNTIKINPLILLF